MCGAPALAYCPLLPVGLVTGQTVHSAPSAERKHKGHADVAVSNILVFIHCTSVCLLIFSIARMPSPQPTSSSQAPDTTLPQIRIVALIICDSSFDCSMPISEPSGLVAIGGSGLEKRARPRHSPGWHVCKTRWAISYLETDACSLKAAQERRGLVLLLCGSHCKSRCSCGSQLAVHYTQHTAVQTASRDRFLRADPCVV
jgi:hypothetical protein